MNHEAWACHSDDDAGSQRIDLEMKKQLLKMISILGQFHKLYHPDHSLHVVLLVDPVNLVEASTHWLSSFDELCGKYWDKITHEMSEYVPGRYPVETHFHFTIWFSLIRNEEGHKDIDQKYQICAGLEGK